MSKRAWFWLIAILAAFVIAPHDMTVLVGQLVHSLGVMSKTLGLH